MARLFLAAALLVLPAATLPACSLKIGGQQLHDPRGDGRSRTRLRLEAEAFSPRVLGGHLEGTAAIGWTPVSRSGETIRVLEPDDTVSTLPVRQQDVTDLRVGARVYPLAALIAPGPGAVEPYLTGGGGYFFSTVTTRGPGEDLCCGGVELDEQTDTVSRGWFPYLGAGINIGLSSDAAILIEARHDFSRDDRGIDTGGTSVMVGVRWGF